MKYTMLILAAYVTFSSCNKSKLPDHELHCPAYDPTTLNTWFPYEEGKTYYYKANDTGIHWLAIQDVKYYNGDEPTSGMECTPRTECFPSGIVFAYRDREQYDKICLSVLHSPTDTGGHLTLSWNSTNTEIVVNTDGTLSLDPMYDKRPEDYYREIKPDFVYHAQRSLNEVTYNDVYEITFKNNDMGNAHKIYLVKDHGIVGYQTQDGLYYWLQQ